jgi:methionyl-tRNA synthetase
MCGRAVELLKEKNYFFKMSKYQSWLIEHMKANPSFVRPVSRYNEVLSFLENNELKDLCISRPKNRLSWGIELPFDKDYVTYVWFDALLNYVSALGWYEGDAKKRFWPAEYHMIAKDILRHHAVYWPIMLKALDMPVVKNIFSHGWWMIDKDGSAEKMSKSKGNVVNPFDVCTEFGVDAFRYFMLREVPFGLDGKYSYNALVTRINSDLANDIGNLVYRTLNMIEKYYGGVIPQGEKKPMKEMTDVVAGLYEKFGKAMHDVAFVDALDAAWDLIRIANKSIEEYKPWALKKEGKDKELADFMYSLAESIRLAAAYLWPFMPKTCESIYYQFGLDRKLPGSMLKEEAEFGLVQGGVSVRKTDPLFPRIETEKK